MSEPVTPTLVWGAGGHGRVVAELLSAAGLMFAGYVDRDQGTHDGVVGPGVDSPIAEEELEACLQSGAHLPRNAVAVALGLGDNETRLNAAKRLGAYLSSAIIHPRALVSASASVGPGSVVLAGVILNTAVRIGSAAIVNSGAIVEHDCVIGDGTHVSPNATVTGSVIVGRGAWIGAGAVVNPGIRIGAFSVIGAGAVVTRDVPDFTKVVGVPARPIRRAK